MWQSSAKEIQRGIMKYQIMENDTPISYRQWINYLQESTDFVTFFIDILKTSEYEGYFWEVKPVNQNRLKEAFEFVLVENWTLPTLRADNTSFQSYFEKGKKVVTFPNLRGDAQLVIPTEIGEADCYPHLAKFVRTAPTSQLLEFWKTVGRVYGQFIGKQTKWLSTAGLGVYWLHVRIDSRPKYYRYNDYRIA